MGVGAKGSPKTLLCSTLAFPMPCPQHPIPLPPAPCPDVLFLSLREGGKPLRAFFFFPTALFLKYLNSFEKIHCSSRLASLCFHGDIWSPREGTRIQSPSEKKKNHLGTMKLEKLYVLSGLKDKVEVKAGETVQQGEHLLCMGLTWI